MKYENFDKVKQYCDLIKRNEKLLENLEACYIDLSVQGSRFLSLMQDSCQNQFPTQTNNFINSIKAEVRDNIIGMRAELEKL